jgi:hypothetical protein
MEQTAQAARTFARRERTLPPDAYRAAFEDAFGAPPYGFGARALAALPARDPARAHRNFFAPRVVHANPGLPYRSFAHARRTAAALLFVDEVGRQYLASSAAARDQDGSTETAQLLSTRDRQLQLAAAAADDDDDDDALRKWLKQASYALFDCAIPIALRRPDLALPSPDTHVQLRHAGDSALRVRVRVHSVLGNDRRRRRTALLLVRLVQLN